jgi:hypothetical protein
LEEKYFLRQKDKKIFDGDTSMDVLYLKLLFRSSKRTAKVNRNKSDNKKQKDVLV